MNNQKGGISYFDSDVIGVAGFTWNPVTGCTKGCPECWARDVARNRLYPAMKTKIKGIYGELSGELPSPKDDPRASHSKCSYLWDKRRAEAERLAEAYRTFHPTLHPERLDQPAKRKKPAVIGVCFMGDLFDPALIITDSSSVFASAHMARHHTYVFLTKRPDRINKLLIEEPQPNWHLGFSARTQEEFDAGWPHMAKLAAAGWRVWVSLEPLQGPVKMPDVICRQPSICEPEDMNCSVCPDSEPLPFSGVIVGAQSGKGAPLLNVEWVRSIRNQCADADVPFMYKQGPNEAGKLVTLPDLDGVKHTALAWGQNVS